MLMRMPVAMLFYSEFLTVLCELAAMTNNGALPIGKGSHQKEDELAA